MEDIDEILSNLEINLDLEIANLLSKNNSKFVDNQILYHYTNLDGLQSIIENESLHFSNSAYLNDKEEFLLGKKIFQNIASTLRKKPNNKENHERLDLLIDKISKTEKSENYVACFSLAGDLLSQWRAYANDGKGVSIGFDLNELRNTLFDVDSFKMIYDEKDQIKLGSQILMNCFNFYIRNRRIIANSDLEFDSIITSEIYKQILKYIGYLKHNAFIEESEYRFEIRIDGNINNERDILFRSSKNNLFVPYIKEKLNKEDRANKNLKKIKFPIKEIIIGPSLDFDLNKISIERFLTKNGHKGVKLKRSNVPYRI